MEENARQARVYTEKAGVNFAIIDSTDDAKGLFSNLALSLSLYSGQMCTTPQNLYIPRDGILANGEKLSFEEVCSQLAKAVEKLLSDPGRAGDILGALQSAATETRQANCKTLGKIVLDSTAPTHPAFDAARMRTPLIVAVDAEDRSVAAKEWFGPIALIIACGRHRPCHRIGAQKHQRPWCHHRRRSFHRFNPFGNGGGNVH